MSLFFANAPRHRAARAPLRLDAGRIWRLRKCAPDIQRNDHVGCEDADEGAGGRGGGEGASGQVLCARGEPRACTRARQTKPRSQNGVRCGRKQRYVLKHPHRALRCGGHCDPAHAPCNIAPVACLGKEACRAEWAQGRVVRALTRCVPNSCASHDSYYGTHYSTRHRHTQLLDARVHVTNKQSQPARLCKMVVHRYRGAQTQPQRQMPAQRMGLAAGTHGSLGMAAGRATRPSRRHGHAA